jgi:heat-inducible transcriptional repressor
MSKRLEESFDERTQRLFKLLVERYLVEGHPVPSKALASEPSVEVSPATVRNIMAELESHGLVRSPHTSAGKVPTTQGLRFFVDSLLSVEPLDESRLEVLKHELNPDLSPSELVECASKLLSTLTRMTCVITLPRRDHISLRQLEFLPLSGDRVLVILVFDDREVQNRVIHTGREYSTVELNQAANYLNREFGGRSLPSIREALLASMQADKDRMDGLMQAALDVASQVFAEPDSGEPDGSQVIVSGESQLLQMSSDTGLLRSLFDAFSRKGRILHLLDQCLQSDGIQLFIGEESGYDFFETVSLVTAPYQVQGRPAGVLGVVGPTRMAYREVIPVVDVTARMLGAAINQG